MKPTTTDIASTRIKGRGATLNPTARFARAQTAPVDDGWEASAVALPEATPDTLIAPEAARSIITRNSSPDVPFDRSINPYRGCEHGCIYCFARPAHSYVDLSPGIDFETRIFYKENAAQLLEQALRKPGYQCAPIALGTNTDPYQGAERTLGVTRELLQVMQRYRHPVTIVTKGALIERDLDLLQDLASDRLVSVMLSVTTLDNDLKRKLEPRTPSGERRLKTVATLAKADIPVGVMVAPVIPAINDHELEAIVRAAAGAGATRCAYILVRLPHEVKALFRDWLAQHYPDRAGHVMSLIRQSRGGKDNDPRFGHRMSGEGVFAQMIGRRFKRACQAARLGINESSNLDTNLFEVPASKGDQLCLL